MRARVLIAVVSVFVAVNVAASDLQHPVIAPIDGFVLRPAAKSEVTEFNEYRFRRKDAQGRDEFFVKKGRFWDLHYHKPAADGSDDTNFSKIEIKDNYQRRREHSFDPVRARRLRIEVLATNGDPSARLYELRVYHRG